MGKKTLDPISDGSAIGVGLSHSFDFSCNKCGACCSYDDVPLSGPDLWRLALYLNKDIQEVYERHTEISLDYGIPILNLKKKTYSGTCTFLRNNLCTVHEARPRTCALYPIARGYLFNSKTNFSMETQYALNVNRPLNFQCNSDSSHTVTQWLQDGNIPLQDDEEIVWNLGLAKIMKKIEQHPNPRNSKVQELLLKGLYLSYDLDIPWILQMESHLEALEIGAVVLTQD